jgi:anaerobic selenocysteine-containing dehydrogenase
MEQELRTTCNRDCPDSCGIVVTVKDGIIIKHRGDPSHKITRGFLCYRGNHYLDRFYSKERILYPQRRTKKGWARISWDDALDMAAENLTHYRDTLGPLSILVVYYSGIRGSVAKLLGSIFWSHFGGATFSHGGLSIESAQAAQDLDFGRNCTHAPEDLENSAGFMIWGKNIAITRPHAWQFVTSARKKGARLHVIDPVQCQTAKRADAYYQIRPGSDAMLACVIGRILIEQGAVDRAFIDRYGHGFESYRKHVLSVSLDEVSAATAPDTGSVYRSLDSLEYLVVVDMFITASAENADLFLPCTTYLEMDDIITAYGHHWIGLSRRVVPPLGEARSDVEIMQDLAERLGFGSALEGEPLQWAARLLKPLNAQGLMIDELTRTSLLNPLQTTVPFSDRNFLTPSGKFEFITEPPATAAPAMGDELQLIATKTLKMLNAQVNSKDNVDEPVVKTHPETLTNLGFKSGDHVLVESSAGRVRALIDADENVRRDVLLFNPAAWRRDLQGVNQLREAVLADMRDAAAMHETKVRLRTLPA